MVSGQLNFGVVCFAIINEKTGEAAPKSGSADQSENHFHLQIDALCLAFLLSFDFRC